MGQGDASSPGGGAQAAGRHTASASLAMLARSMIVWLVVAALLLAAAALKAADRGGSVIALSGYGVPGRLAAPAWVALVVAEAALAAGIGAGVDHAAYAAGGLLAVFMTV